MKMGSRGRDSRESSQFCVLELRTKTITETFSGLTWDEANIALTEIQKDSLM